MDKYDANRISKTNTIRFMSNEKNNNISVIPFVGIVIVVAFVVIFLLFSSFTHSMF